MSYPPLSSKAKNELCQQGPDVFRKLYGNYYINGAEMGAEIKIDITAKTNRTLNEQGISKKL